jgi:PAS domain S-box-containing protein
MDRCAPALPTAHRAAPVPAEWSAPVWPMLQHAQGAVAVADLEGRLVWVNPAWLALWGYGDAQQVRGRRIDEGLWHDADAARAVLRAVREQRSWDGAVEARTAQGAPFSLWCAAHLVDDGDGRPVAMMVTFAERRGGHASGATLASQPQFTETVVDTAGLLFAVLDGRGRFVRFNAECERASGWTVEQVLGRTPWDTVVPPEIADRVRTEAWDTAMASAAPAATTHYTNEWLHRDGSRRLIEWSNRVFDGADGERYMVAVGIDVTEREAARRRLEHSEARLRNAQRVARLGSWHLDLVSGALEWSDEVYRIFEIDPARFGASFDAFLALVHPDDRALVDAAYKRSLRTREPYRVQHRLLMPDGRIKWVEEQGESWFDGRGRALSSDGTVQDVTERVQAQEMLARSEANLRAMLDGYPGWAGVVDDDMRYLYVNDTFARQVGRPREQIVGLKTAELRGEAVEAELRAITSRLQPGESTHTERRYVDATGQDRYYWVHYRATTDGTASGRRLVYGFGIDVTEYRLNELRLKAIVEATGIGTWQWDARAGRLTVDDGCLALVGYTRADVDGDLVAWLLARIHADDREARRAHYTDLLSGRAAAIDSEYRFRHRDGRWVWLLDRGRVATRGADGMPVLVIGATQDIGALKQHQEALAALNAELEQRVEQRTAALAQAKDEAERANAAKTEFLSRMSHELRTPLNAILGFGQLLGMSDLRGEDRGHVGEILRAGQHLLELINEVLDLATIEAGRIQLHLQPVPVHALADECLHLIAPVAAKADVRLSNDVSPSCGQAWADRGRLRQVLLNLLSNAVKYNRPGGCVSVGCRCDDTVCELQVRDTGAGLTPAQVDRLFEPFERLGADRQGIQGTGIGLTVSRRLVELMGGEIDVASTPGEGSTFTVRLPGSGRGRDDSGFVPLADAGGAGTPAPRHATVLYVEDNAANRLLMQRLLEHLGGVRLRVAADADEALAIVQREAPDALLLDIQLPGTDGYALLARLRAAGCSAPAVAVSANAMPADLERGRAAGFVDYLTKPLDIQRTLKVVAALVGPVDEA